MKKTESPKLTADDRARFDALTRRVRARIAERERIEEERAAKRRTA